MAPVTPWRLLLTAFCLGAIGSASSGVPAVDIGNGAFAAAGARVPPNLLLNLALSESAAAAAYPDTANYQRSSDYLGYFNPHSCYTYPYQPASGAVAASPDLSEASGYFSPIKPADALHECGGATFSGNFLNWASASTLDILRYALSGGDRVIDTAGLTVLQRAYLPDGQLLAPTATRLAGDFYANPVYFPRKLLGAGAGASLPSQVTPFATPTLYIVSCRNRILFSDSAVGGNCDAPAAGAASDRRFGQFLARVAVCDRTEGPQRPDLCTAYGSAYKPTGALQANAGSMRAGLISYLTEHAAGEPNQYGGVLRAPLDYIGLQRYAAPDFSSAVVNAGAEWSRSSGVLSADPAHGATPFSGMINYINRLGRGTPSHSGRYKVDAPLGELYYESLRYVQGRQPGAAAANADSDDGFPVLRSWTDPLLAACQRTVVLTVANSDAAEDRFVPGNTRGDYLDAARAEDVFGSLAPMNVMDWTRRVGAMEADAAASYGNPAPRPGLAGLELKDTGLDGRGTYYMAGLAYWAHTRPLRADLSARAGYHAVDNYVIDLDIGGNASLADSSARLTAPRSSQLYLAAKYGGFLDDNLDGNPFQTTGSATGAVNSDIEWSGNGDAPAHYFLGSDPASLIAAVRAIFASANAVPGRTMGTALMALRTAREDAYLFQTDFTEPGGTGRLSRLSLGLDEHADLQTGAPLWEAGRLLSGDVGAGQRVLASPTPALRKIYTANMLGNNGASVVPFEWSMLSAAQRDALDRPPAPVGAASGAVAGLDGLGEQRLAFLRGERGGETGQPGALFRRRGGVLGDSINAAPVYVGKPSATMLGAGYASFYAAHQTRRPVVYLGANDGLLHAFDATNGAELFAYLPNALIGGVNVLSAPAYGAQPYVDGGAAVGEVLAAGQWKSILVSGMGGGAQGVFALDVSDPEHFSTGGGLVWEFTDKDDAAIGNVMAPPSLVKLKIGGKVGLPEYRYFALIASGLNNYVNDGKSRFTAAGDGVLFLLALDKPVSAPWTLGVNYYKLTTPIADPSMPNALGPPALVMGADGAARYAYAGDLQGNLWRFDFTGAPPWSSAVGPGDGKQPLFVARDDSGRRQPITQQPNVVFAPGGGYLILFGTGQFFGKTDTLAERFQPQSLYAMRDPAGATKTVVAGRSALALRSLSAAAAVPNSTAAAVPNSAATPEVSTSDLLVLGAAFDYLGASAKAGWYLDFVDTQRSGERSVSNGVLAAGKVFFNTILPGTDACAEPATRTYGLDALTGLAFDGTGRPQSGLSTGVWSMQFVRSSPVVVDMSAAVGQRDATGRATATRQYIVLNPGKPGAGSVPQSGLQGAGRKAIVSMPAKRISWREVANWRELHEAVIKQAVK